MSQHSDPAVTAARAIAGNAADQPGNPFTRLAAWRTLVEARGGIFRSQTLPAVTHVKSAPVPTTLQECLDLQAPTVRARVLARAAQIGIRVPGPTGGDAA